MKKNSTLWLTNNGTNTSGFSVLPGGWRSRYGDGRFGDIGGWPFFWSATESSSSTDAIARNLDNGIGSFNRWSTGYGKSAGAYVRCLKD